MSYVLFKQCSKCQLEKSAHEFSKNNNAKDGLGAYCRDCKKQYSRNRYQNPLIKQKQTLAVKLWQRQNKHRLKKQQDLYNSKPWCRARVNIAGGLSGLTPRVKSSVGLSTEEFRLFIEKLLPVGMSWNDYGSKWKIQRIKPISSFDLNNPIEVLNINHYSNLKVVEFKG